MAKGGQFEREFCTALSSWWSDGRTTDGFWRSSMSGGRATVRGRKGERTEGHYGDVTATHPSGNVLMDVVTIELKRGYKKTTVSDVLDYYGHTAQQQFECWIQQAITAHETAGSFAWMLVHRRTMRNAMVYIPKYLSDALKRYTDWTPSELELFGTFRTTVRFRENVGSLKKPKWKSLPSRVVRMVGFPLDGWFNTVTPQHIKTLAKEV